MEEGFVDADGVLIYYKSLGKRRSARVRPRRPGRLARLLPAVSAPARAHQPARLHRRARLRPLGEARGPGRLHGREHGRGRRGGARGRSAWARSTCSAIPTAACSRRPTRSSTSRTCRILILCSTFHSTKQLNDVFERDEGEDVAGAARAHREGGKGRPLRPRQGLREEPLHQRLHDRRVGRGLFPVSLRAPPRSQLRPGRRPASCRGISIARCGARTANSSIDGNLVSVEYGTGSASIRVPTLITVGDHDECDPSLSRDMQEKIAGSKLVILPRAGT